MPKPVRHPSTGGRQDIRVGTQVLRVEIRPGDGTGTPLLMLGGIGAGLQVLQPLVDAVGRGTEVIRVDVPGVGGSPLGMPYNLAQLAWQISRLLDGLGYRKVDVLGYSWGGALAQQFTLQCPNRTRRLVLISTSTGALSIPGDLRGITRMLTPHQFSDPDDAVLLIDQVNQPAGIAMSDETSQRLRATRGGWLGYLQQLAALSTWTSLPFLPFIRQPTLVISADDDPIVPVANARVLAGLLPNSTLRTVSGGHAAVITAAWEVGRMVDDFLFAGPTTRV